MSEQLRTAVWLLERDLQGRYATVARLSVDAPRNDARAGYRGEASAFAQALDRVHALMRENGIDYKKAP